MSKQIYCEWLNQEDKKERDPNDPQFMGCNLCLKSLDCIYLKINKKLRKLEMK